MCKQTGGLFKMQMQASVLNIKLKFPQYVLIILALHWSTHLPPVLPDWAIFERP